MYAIRSYYAERLELSDQIVQSFAQRRIAQPDLALADRAVQVVVEPVLEPDRYDVRITSYNVCYTKLLR